MNKKKSQISIFVGYMQMVRYGTNSTPCEKYLHIQREIENRNGTYNWYPGYNIFFFIRNTMNIIGKKNLLWLVKRTGNKCRRISFVYTEKPLLCLVYLVRLWVIKLPSPRTWEKEIQLLIAIEDLAEARIWPKGEKESTSALSSLITVSESPMLNIILLLTTWCVIPCCVC